MNLSKRWLTLTSLFFFLITTSQEQSTCNDTKFWNNNYYHPCSDYEFNVLNHWWCPNDTYTSATLWTGGNTYKYPEFNCCACGKGWPLWFVPSPGYTAMKAIPKIRMNMTNNLICNDTYRNLTACTMKCKALGDNSSVTSLQTISTADFNSSKCTLDLSMKNNSVQYILQIPVDNYLIYFTNWTTNDYNMSCVNNTGVVTSSMLCRYEFDEYPFESPSCPSGNITSRYIRPGCADTDNWGNNYGYSCFEYEMTKYWCANGTFTQQSLWTGGATYKYPEQNCCACGKESLSPILVTSVTNSSINSSEFEIIHLEQCTTSENRNSFFDLKCSAPLNFTNTNTTMIATLYNCPLDCFFDWNITQLNRKQSINVSRQLFGSSVSYYLKFNLFSHDSVVCGPLINEESTSKQIATSQSTIITHSSSTYQIPTTTEQPVAWQPPKCPNGKIGLNCNLSVDPCSMAEPCLNNGTCLNTNSSYTCLCPPLRFTGVHCEIDIRPCKPYTCLSHGTCIETNPTSFICQCDAGYEGINCEALVNYCRDVKCENNGQCQPSRLNFTCQCTTKDFSGRLCEIKSSALARKQIVKRSFAYIAIIALVLVVGIIVLMDILKYGFNIDPVEEERQRLQAQKILKKKKPVIIRRYIYVN